ncbi:hypothetical protein WJX77_004739 [Trebouxia sp. C0004]
MSISTQPAARQPSLQRASSSRLSMVSMSDIKNTRTGIEATNKSGFATMEHTSSLKQPLHTLDLPPALSQAAAFQSAPPQAPDFHILHPQITSRQCHWPQYCHAPSQTAVSAAANYVPNPVQAWQQLVSAAEQPYNATLHHLQAKEGHSGAQPSMHLRKRPCLGTEADICSRLDRHAEQLQAEYAAVRAGTGRLDDQAAWIAAARKTAHQMQEAARVKVMRAFKSALRYMDEDTLMSKVANHLQLQESPCEIPQAAQLSDGSLQAPQILSCPKKARSRRFHRPASAASQGISRVPSQGGATMPSMNRPVSAPAERSGWDWAEELPATTSALLQAVEAAAAAAEPEADDVVQQEVDIASTAGPAPAGHALVLSPPTWTETITNAQQMPSTAPDFLHHADHAATHASAAAALAATPAAPLRVLRDAACCDIPMAGQAMAEAVDAQPAEHRYTDSSRDADRLVLRPVMRSALQQGMHVCNPLHPLAGLPADKLSSLKDCNGLSAFSHIADNAVSDAHLAGPYANDSSYMPTGAIALRSNPGGSPMHACWLHQLMHVANILPGKSKPVPQSPFAAMADVPIHSAATPMLSHQGSSAATHCSSHKGPTQAGPTPATPQRAFIVHPAGCHLRQASLPSVPCERGTVQFDSIQTATTDAASDAVKEPALTTRPPLSPSTLDSNGQGALQRPAAKAQHSLAQSAQIALGMNATSSDRKRSFAHSQERCLPPDMHIHGLHAVCQTELLPGRNVIVAAGYVNDLTQLQILPSKWCWVARIDKVMAAHMKVSFYGKHNGRWTLARHGAGTDEGQVYTGDVSLSVHQVLAVFDRFTGSKEVPADVLCIATGRLCSVAGRDFDADQENMTLQDGTHSLSMLNI